MPKIVTKEYYIERVKEKLKSKPHLTVTGKVDGRWDMTNKIKEKLSIHCSVHDHVFSLQIKGLLSKNIKDCPKCLGKYIPTQQEREEQIIKICDKKGYSFLGWVDGYKSVVSKLKLKCNHDNCEWSVMVKEIINKDSGCPRCAGVYKYSSEERVEQINTKGIGKFVFVKWANGYDNTKSKAVLKCLVDDHEWSTDTLSIVISGSGCPKCAGKYRWTADERIYQINARSNIEFIEWVGEYTGSSSKAKVRCLVDGHEWSPSINNIVTKGSGCPRCTNQGFDTTKAGYFYLYEWKHPKTKHSFYKYGVTTRTLKKRHQGQARKTKYIAELVGYRHFASAADALKLEGEFDRMFPSSVVSKEDFPDGYTETFYATEEEIEDLCLKYLLECPDVV